MQIHINTYGTSLRIVNGVLSIKKDKDYKQIALNKIDAIHLHRGITLSTDVVYQCLENGIDILLLERGGRPAGRLWNNRFGSISTIRKAQLDYAASVHVIPWVADNIIEKLENQAELLLCFLSMAEPEETLIRQTITRFKTLCDGLQHTKTLPKDEAAGKIRALEGQGARLYFDCVNRHMPNRFKFSKRSKRPALDMTNSMLNYCYGSLYGQLESSLIKAGLDPFIGFFHRDEYNRPVLTYDIIEPFRPWADWVVFHLCMNEVLDETFFEVSEGGYWMMGDGKRILIQHFVDFFEEIIDYKGLHHSRYMMLEKRCIHIAKMIQEVPHE